MDQLKECQRRADLYNTAGVKPPPGQRCWSARDFMPDARPRRTLHEIAAIYGIKPPTS